MYFLIHISLKTLKRLRFITGKMYLLWHIYHRHSFATEHFDGAESRVEGHVREDVDDRNESARNADGQR